MVKEYKGTIIEESLEDNQVLNNLEILESRLSEGDNSDERWHLYTVKVDRDEINNLSRYIKTGWYMHFWHVRNIIAVFKGKTFEFDYDDKSSWKDVVEYGLSVGIPREQLDFVIQD